MVISGIDPGKSGAIAFLELTEFYEIKSAKVYDSQDSEGFNELRDLAWEQFINIRAFMEKPFGFMNEGTHRMVGYGIECGKWLGACKVLNIRCDQVAPSLWKDAILPDRPPAPSKKDIEDPNEYRKAKRRHYGALKKYSVGYARELFPDLAKPKLSRIKDDGRAEALLIAEFGRQVLGALSGVKGFDHVKYTMAEKFE